MRRKLCEAGQLLKHAKAVDVDVVVVDTAESRSLVQITLHDVPGPLGGLQVGPPVDD